MKKKQTSHISASLFHSFWSRFFMKFGAFSAIDFDIDFLSLFGFENVPKMAPEIDLQTPPSKLKKFRKRPNEPKCREKCFQKDENWRPFGGKKVLGCGPGKSTHFSSFWHRVGFHFALFWGAFRALFSFFSRSVLFPRFSAFVCA